MKDDAILTIPELREVCLVPMEVVEAHSTPIRDEKGGVILAESGAPIYEG